MQRLKDWKTNIFKAAPPLFTLTCCSDATQILAQARTETGTTSEKSYFLAYLLVLFLIAFGVAIVARSGRRAEKPKMIEKELEYRLEKMSGKSGDM